MCNATRCARPLVSCHWLPNMLRDPFHNLLFTYILNYMLKICSKYMDYNVTLCI